ncbi:MAG: PIN domain-containing protein [Hormoscilla sp.]
MKMILYLETNFIMAIAKGRDGLVENILQNPPDDLTIAIPSICLMESLVAWEREQKRSQSFRQAVAIEINEAKRNQLLQDSQSVVDFLQQSINAYEKLLVDLENRFKNVFEIFKNQVELIHPKIEDIQLIFAQPLLKNSKERRDDFILRCILDHAQANSEETKAFFSENIKPFGQSDVRESFREVGITYFSKIENLQGWLSSLETT